ncbi:MAG: IclR family transcriptional regulator [Enterobacteriaceae bacterium]
MSEQVKSLIKSMQLLEYLSQHPNGMALHELTKISGINKTSVHRILSTFEELGYVAQFPDTRAYRLTLKMLHVGHGALSANVLGSVRPILSGLMDEINETINFISREGDKIVFRDKLEPQFSSFRTRTFVGMYFDMYCTAAGKVFLAFSSRQDQENYWQRNQAIIRPLTDNTIVHKQRFFEEMESIRQQGYAFDNEENEAGISCIAVPVFDHSGSPAYAVSVSTLTPRMRAMGAHTLAASIRRANEQIEDKLFRKGDRE